MSGRVYLVGAGCGGPELLTLRAAKLLRACSCVVYDDLIDPAILDLAPPEAERVYMGKRSGRHSAPQAEINALLIEKARAGDVVVRLKGGDPFVFGRGGEEMLALAAAGVVCEAVPGISSAIAIPELAGIPLTHRGLSRSFHVVTAHSAAPGDTLPELTRRLIAAGLPPETPAAVLSGGNSPHPADVRGTLEDIAGRAAQVEAPAVIIIGEVAAVRLGGPGLPLSGLRVGLTGTPVMQEKLRALFEAEGARVFSATCSRVVPLAAELPEDLEEGGWIVLTSANGVGAFFRLLSEHGFDLRRLSRCRFAVIGPATGAALREHGLLPDLCPELHTSAGLADALLAAGRPGERVHLFRSALAGRELPEALSASFRLSETALYTVETRLCRRSGADYLLFSSAQGVRDYFAAGGDVSVAVCVSIGPVTSAALRSLGSGEILEAEEISARGLLSAVLRHRSG